METIPEYIKQDGEGDILLEYIPELPEYSEFKKNCYDIPDKYIVIECPDAANGIMIYGYYGKYRKEWLPNPQPSALIKYLLGFYNRKKKNSSVLKKINEAYEKSNGKTTSEIDALIHEFNLSLYE